MYYNDRLILSKTNKNDEKWAIDNKLNINLD